MAITQANFWDKVALNYSKQAISDPDSYAKKLKSTQALMNQSMNVIEFGCGTGSTALLHAPHVAQITATDVSERMIAIGQEKAEHQGVNNIIFKQSSVEGFKETETSYDMVLALNLIHLLSDRKAALNTFSRILKPGGYLVTSTVCLSDKRWFLAPVIKIMQSLGKAPGVEFIHPDTVMEDIRAAGFTCQENWAHGRVRSVFLIAKKDD